MKVIRAAAVLTVAAVIMTIFVSVSAMADEPTIDGVMVQQRWPWSRLVDIDYVLMCEGVQSVDVTIQAYNGETALSLPEASFSGDINGVLCGVRRIIWDPTMTAYTNNGVLPKFRVALTPALSPLYMIVDLTKQAGAEGQIEYVYEQELTNGLWGTWVRNPVTNDGTVVNSVVWTGVTTNDIYKTDKLVLRRIPKGTFKMGNYPPTLSTTLTRDFYAGVFQVTQRQWELVTGAKPSKLNNPAYYMTRPVETVSYNAIRGATNNVPAINWPGTGALVLPSSFLGRLRTQTGLKDFDLPTEAQLDYACRAGTTTYFNDGVAGTPSGTHSNAQMDALGRYERNGGKVWNGTAWDLPGWDCGASNGTAIVGSYLPNAWGLYDTHGNVWECCLNWYEDTPEGGFDPVGAESGSDRVNRGGSWYLNAASCHSAVRNKPAPAYGDFNIGLRLVMTLP